MLPDIFARWRDLILRSFSLCLLFGYGRGFIDQLPAPAARKEWRCPRSGCVTKWNSPNRSGGAHLPGYQLAQVRPLVLLSLTYTPAHAADGANAESLQSSVATEAISANPDFAYKPLTAADLEITQMQHFRKWDLEIAGGVRYAGFGYQSNVAGAFGVGHVHFEGLGPTALNPAPNFPIAAGHCALCLRRCW